MNRIEEILNDSSRKDHIHVKKITRRTEEEYDEKGNKIRETVNEKIEEWDEDEKQNDWFIYISLTF